MWQGMLDKFFNKLTLWKKGGLGVRNLKLYNRSLLFKWQWQYSSNGDAVWKQITESVYGMKDGWRPCCTNLNSKGWIWKNIVRLCDDFHQHTRLVVDNGAKI